MLERSGEEALRQAAAPGDEAGVPAPLTGWQSELKYLLSIVKQPDPNHAHCGGSVSSPWPEPPAETVLGGQDLRKEGESPKTLTG